jgi:hypothetical protein
MCARVSLLFLSLTAISACGSHSQAPVPRDATSRRALLLTENETAPGRHCRIVDADQPLPNVATVLDTAAIPEYLRQIGIASDTGHAVLSLRYDSTGQATRERMIEYTVPDSLAESLRSVIASALLPRPVGAPLAARLRIDLGPTPRYQLGKSEYCEAEVIAAAAPTQPVDVTIIGRSTHPVSTLPSAAQYKYTVEVSGAGEVLSVKFDSSVPSNLLDGFRTHVLHERWKPALDDGMPVNGTGKGSVATTAVFEERVVPVVRPAP